MNLISLPQHCGVAAVHFLRPLHDFELVAPVVGVLAQYDYRRVEGDDVYAMITAGGWSTTEKVLVAAAGMALDYASPARDLRSHVVDAGNLSGDFATAWVAGWERFLLGAAPRRLRLPRNA